MTTPTTAKPTATATIEPVGPRTTVPREHLVTVMIRLSGIDARYADKGYVAGVARKSLEGFPPAKGRADRRTLVELSVSSKVNHQRGTTNVVVGVEGSAPAFGRPREDAVAGFCDALAEAGYRVELREKRECAEPGCPTAAVVDWNRPEGIPPSWYSHAICGRHNYRTCPKCKSSYVLTSTNSVGHAPSVACEVCGALMIGWGGSKLWTAELVTRGALPAAAASRHPQPKPA
jgi:hypothetical protein